MISRALSRSLPENHGNSDDSAVRPIITTCSTVTGKFQSMSSSCGT